MAEINVRKDVWKDLEDASADLVKRAQAMKKRAFMEMPGGMPQGDPAAAGMPPGADPAAMGAMPPDAAGAMPPGAQMDPAMMAAMGGVPPMGVDPATAGMLGGMPPDAGAGAAAAGAAPAPEPTITITLSQLWDIVTKVLGLAKKIGANGQGITADAAPAPTAGGVSQDAIKTAVIEALGSMGAMKMAADSGVGSTNQVPKITPPKGVDPRILGRYFEDRTNTILHGPRTLLPKGVDPRILGHNYKDTANTIPERPKTTLPPEVAPGTLNPNF